MKEAVLYKKEKKGKVRCLACSHYCLIAENSTGICGVRRNIGGKLFLMVYGLPCSVAIDPIEKKPLFHFLPGTLTLSLGTVGCNFGCDFCQNCEISQASKGKSGRVFGEELTPKQVVDMALKNKCPSISYTYNEPAIFSEYVHDIAELAREKGLKNVLVTNGYMSKEGFAYLSKYIDAMNIDLKGNDDFYRKTCGAKLMPVMETIKRAHAKKIHVEITTLIIPGENDSLKELEKIAKFIASVDKNIPWHLSRFFPRYNMLHKSITPLETLEAAHKIGKKYLNNVYTGNI
jgi:pyruvate formate lyase activating enzyme